eukprot:2837963-Prymnesium_polylepis.1
MASIPSLRGAGERRQRVRWRRRHQRRGGSQRLGRTQGAHGTHHGRRGSSGKQCGGQRLPPQH